MKSKIPKLKQLHKTVFQDGDNYIEFFFEKRFSPKYCWVHEEDGQPVGAVYARNVFVRLDAKTLAIPFITGVATHPDHRGKGIASMLMKKALKYFEDSKIPLSLLHPFNADFYRKLDYEVINFTHDQKIQYSPAKGVTYKEVNSGDIPLLFNLYQDFASGLFAAAPRSLDYIGDMWEEHSKDGGMGYIVLLNGIPNGYILCGDGEVFESFCKDNSLLNAIKEIDGYKFRELPLSWSLYAKNRDDLERPTLANNNHGFANQTYSMASVGCIPSLLTAVPYAKGAEGEWVFAVDKENYLLKANIKANGDSVAVCEKTNRLPDFHITKRQLVSIALGGGRRYADGIPAKFLSLFPRYQIFIYDRF